MTERRVKVLYLAGQSCNGGAPTAMHTIVRNLKHIVTVVGVVYSDKGPASMVMEQEEVPCYYCKIPYISYPALHSFYDLVMYIPRGIRTFFYHQKSKIYLSNLVEQLKPDIIHTNIGPLQIGDYLSKKYNIPNIWHIRERQQEFKIYPFPSECAFKHKVRQENNYVLSITKVLYDYYELSENNAQVLYDGVIDSIHPLPIINYEPSNYFIFVGAIVDAKGVTSLIRAFNLFARTNKDTELWIAGKGNKSYVSNLKEKIHNLGIEKRVRFLGYRDDVPTLMHDARAVIMSSPYEGFGFVTVEAMFQGTIVIGYDAAGTKEQFDNGIRYAGKEIGLRYKTIEQLKEIMLDVVSKPKNTFSDMIEAAQTTVDNLYSIKKQTEKLFEIYNNVINNRHGEK